jgi:adenosylcobinamide-GDP ribazoletransferase
MKPFWIALSTLTLFPIGVKKWTSQDLKNSLVFYPLVGLFLGFLVSLNRFWPAPVSVQALFALLTGVFLTLGFHLDGLADCLDGWLGGKNPAQRYRIMKDPSIGTYGAAGLFLLLLSKYAFLQLLLGRTDAWKYLTFIPAAARWCVCLASFLHSAPSHYKGLAVRLLGMSAPRFFISGLFLIPGFFFFPLSFIFILAGGAGFTIFWTALSKRMIGGLTGDGLGALIELTEAGLLLLAALTLI